MFKGGIQDDGLAFSAWCENGCRAIDQNCEAGCLRQCLLDKAWFTTAPRLVLWAGHCVMPDAFCGRRREGAARGAAALAAGVEIAGIALVPKMAG
jgi:hypothetical protein